MAATYPDGLSNKQTKWPLRTRMISVINKQNGRRNQNKGWWRRYSNHAPNFQNGGFRSKVEGNKADQNGEHKKKKKKKLATEQNNKCVKKNFYELQKRRRNNSTSQTQISEKMI